MESNENPKPDTSLVVSKPDAFAVDAEPISNFEEETVWKSAKMEDLRYSKDIGKNLLMSSPMVSERRHVRGSRSKNGIGR